MAADVPADALEKRTTELLNIIIQFPSDTHSVQCSTNVEWWRNWKRTFIAPNNTPGPRFRIYCDLRKLFQRRLILTNQSHPLTFSSPYQSIQCKPRESSKHILNKNNSIHFQCLLLIRRCPRLSLSLPLTWPHELLMPGIYYGHQELDSVAASVQLCTRDGWIGQFLLLSSHSSSGWDNSWNCNIYSKSFLK